MPSRQEQFAKRALHHMVQGRVRELIKEAQNLSPAGRKRVVVLLEETRKRIVGELASLDPQTFSAGQRRALKQSIDQAMEVFARDATASVQQLQGESFRLGQAVVDLPLAEAGLLSYGQVSRQTLAIAQDYTADLVTGLSRESAAKLNASIQRAFLGGQSMTDIIAQVGRAIGGEKFTGLFSPIGERAKSIAMNEILRVHSIAEQARLEQLASQLPGVVQRKAWRWVNLGQEPRSWHQDISGQEKPVNEPFEVPNPKAGIIEELMFPRDPAGSPENTINCHCILEPVIDLEAIGSRRPLGEIEDRLRKLGIEITQV